MIYYPDEVVPKCLGQHDYWQSVGDIGYVCLVSLFPFLKRFPLRLKILDCRVQLDVVSGDALYSGIIV